MEERRRGGKRDEEQEIGGKGEREQNKWDIVDTIDIDIDLQMIIYVNTSLREM